MHDENDQRECRSCDRYGLNVFLDAENHRASLVCRVQRSLTTKHTGDAYNTGLDESSRAPIHARRTKADATISRYYARSIISSSVRDDGDPP